MKTIPLPAPAMLATFEIYIQHVVDARLKAAGVLKATPGPREIRIARGFEIATVAQIAGVSAATISRIERGLIHNPSPDTLNRIARGLGCSEIEYRTAVAAQIGAVQ